MESGKRQHMIGALGLIVLLASAVVVVFGVMGRGSSKPIEDADQFTPSGQPFHPVTINQPDGPPRVHTGMTGPQGQPVTAACSSCHNNRPPNVETHTSSDLNEFHQGLVISHGDLSCLSCHNAANYDTLKRADGKPIEYQNVMQLCAQCHGPQFRDYQNGSHGGMTGYWDRTKGPRQRNNCIDCHDPHKPVYPKFQPVFPPKDRFRPLSNHSPEEDQPHE